MGLFDLIKRLLGYQDIEFPAPPHTTGQGAPSPYDTSRDTTANPASPATASNVAVPIPSPPASGSLAGLDLGKFTPLSTADALAETQTADWRSAYLDSMSVIPPEDLPRIRVIDRTMVGLGLISEKELSEIHEVGREMDQFSNWQQAIDTSARQAVARSRQERQRIKDQKKLEAEQRKQAHAKAVAHRRATDIVYLGRGVSRGLADRRSNLEKLEANELPVLSTPAELADALGIAIPKLRWLAFHSDAPTLVHYVSFTVPKKSGGVRRLAKPHVHMANAQRWILEELLNKLPLHDAAHGFVRGRSTVTNATCHVGAGIVVNVDLADFFPTITFYRAEGLFRSFGYSPAVATILGLLCTECPRETVRLAGETLHPATGSRALPQGACTSPAISNLISRNLDHRLTGMANRLGWRYTRYADDLTFSANADQSGKTGYLLARVRHICRDEGFRLNAKKTRVLKANSRQSVTGVVVNHKTSVPRKTIRRLRAILHQARHRGLASQNRDDHPNFVGWLRGMIAYVEMVNPEQGAKLRRDFESLSG